MMTCGVMNKDGLLEVREEAPGEGFFPRYLDIFKDCKKGGNFSDNLSTLWSWDFSQRWSSGRFFIATMRLVNLNW